MPYRLNPNALLVKGSERSTVCDPERSTFHIIPNSLYQILAENKTGEIDQIKAKYAENDPEISQIIQEYFDMLIEKDLIFFTNFPQYYTDLSMEWDYPAHISNAIIDFRDQNTEAFFIAAPQLEAQLTRFIQLRFFGPIAPDTIEKMMQAIDESIIESIEIIAPFQSFNDQDKWFYLLKTYPRIAYFQFYGSPDYKEVTKENHKSRGQIFTVKNALTSETHCGVIASHYFTVNIPTFTESQHHNTCLNRKISIDKDGYIKNCPSMLHHFGHISETKLEDVIKNPEFTKYWNIKKDDISKCKDCEFRHICTDCRAYLENPEDLHSAPLKCGYNPYTCQWEDWSTNPLKQKAIEHYNLTELMDN